MRATFREGKREKCSGRERELERSEGFNYIYNVFLCKIKKICSKMFTFSDFFVEQVVLIFSA